MSGKVSAVIAGLALGVMVAPVAAQNAPQRREPAAQGRVQNLRPRTDPARESRYQIGVMERVLEDAVEHGFSNWRDRWQTVLPAQTTLLDNAHVRGYRLEGFGVFFDVEVPSLETTWFSVLRTLDQNGLGLENALKTVKAHIEASGDVNLEQALKRIELQVAPAPGLAAAAVGQGARGGVTLPGATPSAGRSDAVDPILEDPEEVYRAEVIHSLSDAILDHGGPLDITGEESLWVGAGRNDSRPRLAPLDSNSRKIVLRLHGSDLRAFRAGQISRDQALERIEVRVF